MMTLTSLYKATEEADRAFASVNEWCETHADVLCATGGAIPDEINREYDEAMRGVEKAVEREALKLIQMRAESTMLQDEISRLVDRRDTNDTKIKLRTRMLEEHFVREGRESYATALVTVQMHNNPPKVIAPMWSNIELGLLWASPKYDWCVKRSEPQFALDKEAIKKAYRETEDPDVPEGIRLVQERHIRIK